MNKYFNWLFLQQTIRYRLFKSTNFKNSAVVVRNTVLFFFISNRAKKKSIDMELDSSPSSDFMLDPDPYM